MGKNIGIVLGGIVISYMLLALCTWLFLRSSVVGDMILEGFRTGNQIGSQVLTEKYGDPAIIMKRGLQQIQFIIGPIVSVSVGIFVGLFSRRHVWQLSALSLVPFAIFMVVAHSWNLAGIGLGLLYLAMSVVSALGILTVRTRTTKG